MPVTVPTLQPGDEVGPEVAQGGTIDVQTNPQQMGGALAQGIGSAGGDLEKVGLQQKQLFDDTTIQAASTQLGQSSMKKLYDPQTGILAQHGPNAAAAADKAVTDFQAERDKLIAGLSDNAQREQVMKIAAGQQFEMEHWAGRHVAQEAEIHQQQTYQDANSLSVQKGALGASDPTTVTLAHTEIAHNLDRQAEIQGWSPEQKEAEALKWNTQLHAGVLEQMLTDHQPAVAKQYLAANGAEMDVHTRDHYTAAVQVGDTLGKAQQNSDQIVGSSKNLGEAIPKIQAITDPQERQETQQQVEHAFAIKDRVVEQQSRENFNTVMTRLQGNGGLKNTLSGSELASLTFEQRDMVDNYCAQMAKKGAVTTDLPTYFDLRAGFANPATRDAYANKDPSTYLDKLSTADMKEYAGWRAEALASGSQGARKLPGLFSHEQMLNDTLAASGIDPRPYKEDPNGGAPTVNPDAIAFRRQIQAQVDAYQEQTGKPMPDDEYQKRIDALLIKQHTSTTTDRSWYNPARWVGDSTSTSEADVPTFKLPGADKLAYSDHQVPDADRQRIADQFEKAGLKPSLHQVSDIYNTEVTGKRGNQDPMTEEGLQRWRTVLQNPQDPNYQPAIQNLRRGLQGYNEQGEFDPATALRSRQILAILKAGK